MRHNELLLEHPFEYFKRRSDKHPPSNEAILNWYKARAFVLSKLKDISFPPGCDQHLHILLEGDSPLMLSVLRQVALSAHYPNYVEYDANHNRVCKNRTIITLTSKRNLPEILHELEKEEYLCNLLKYCKHTIYGSVRNENSFIDLELEIVKESVDTSDCIYIREEDITAFLLSTPNDEIYAIDTRKATYASRAYRLGAAIDNLPYEDIYSAGRYNQALDTFQYRVLQGKGRPKPLVSSQWDNDINAVRNGLSNILCADCFESRELAMRQLCPGYEKLSSEQRMAVWEKNNNSLSLSEHSRWVVEKLILGFSPLSKGQRLQYEALFGEGRQAYRALLKNDCAEPTHLDLCSYWDLRRVDPDNMKYDSFLMLAIPLILDKIRNEDKRK